MSFFSNKKNQNYNNNNNIYDFQKDNLLEKTKNSVKDLIKYNYEFKNTSQYPGEQIDDIKIKTLLLPVYDKIYEIREDLNKFSQMQQINKNKNNISTKQFNDMQSLHTNMVFNKNLIDDTINYMNEKIENVQYEQINKEFQEITSMLESLNIEMDNMVNEFNNKYEKIIKEKKRQKIANDLLSGNYNKNPKNNYDFFSKNDNLKIHDEDEDDEENNMDYNKYKFDIDDLNEEKENLMLKYLEDKQKAINGLPKLVRPNEKVSFKYEIQPPNYNNDKNINNINNINGSNNINNNNDEIINRNSNNAIADSKIEKDNLSINNNIDNNNINSNNINNINNNNIEYSNKPKSSINNIKGILKNKNENNKNNINNYNKNYNSNNKPVNYMEDNIEDSKNNNIQKPVDLMEAMNDFQSKMNKMSNEIIVGKPRKNFKPKIVNTGPTKDDYLRNIQPRSNASKVTYQNFEKQKQPHPYIFNQKKFKKNPVNYKIGKYPNEGDKKKMNDFVEQNPSRPIKMSKGKNININNSNTNNSLLNKEIRKIVDLNVKSSLASYGINSQRNRNLNNSNYGGGNNDELLKILIQKFDDIESAIRETKNNRNGNNNFIQNDNQGLDVNEILANEIYYKVYSQIHSMINNNINLGEVDDEIGPIPQEKKSFRKKEEESIKRINVFEDNNNVGVNDLDKMIPQPRDLNLHNYNEISDTSSCVEESLLNKNKNNVNNYNNIEINKINIREDKLFYENNNNINNNNKNVDVSLSKGEVRSESNSEDDEYNIQSEFNKQKYYKKDNNFYNKKRNKTGNDLLMLKYINENIPDNFNNYNINNINNNSSNDNNYYLNNNNNINNNNSFKNEERPEINMNDNELLKKYKLYKSDEYKKFKNNFQEKMNNNITQTQSNFANLSNPNYRNYNYNSTYTQFRPLIQSNQNMNNTMGSLKLNKISNKDVDELNKKLEQLKIKDNLKSKELGLLTNNQISKNEINANNINNNNFNYNNVVKGIKNSGDYSSGEVRSEDSY